LTLRTITTENPSRDVRRFLQHWGDPEFVADRLRAQLPTIGAALARSKAKAVASGVSQGLEYLVAGEATPLLTKPLPLFYAAENFAKASVVASDPTLVASDFKSHGISGDDAKRYSVKNLRCRVQKPSKDTWSRAYNSMNADFVVLDRLVDGAGQRGQARNEYPTTQLHPGSVLVLGDLLKRLPELVDDVTLADWGHSHVVHVSNYRIVQTTGSPTTQAWVTLRHGHDQAVRAMILAKEKTLLRGFSLARDLLDIVEYHGAGADLSLPPLRMDVFGDLYMDLRGSQSELSEFLLYLAALHILSHAVRYSAEQWKRLLDDHPREAILVDRFLDIVIRKLPNLVLNELSQDIYLFRFAR
jgi:hypothetical protein